MIVDFICGRLFAKNYINGLYTNRIEIDETIDNYKGLVTLLNDELGKAFQEVQVVSETVSNVLNELTILKNNLDNSTEIDNGSIDIKIRELLAVLSYDGIEVYVIRRPDLQSTELTTDVRAYIIDQNDSYFPSINRVVNGSSYTFENPEDANISTVIMSFLNDFQFSDVVNDTIELRAYKEKYTTLETMHSGWTLDVSKLEQFFNNYGYRFVVVF